MRFVLFYGGNIGAEAGAKGSEGVRLQVSISYRCSPFSAMEWHFAFEDVMPKGEESLKERWSKGFRERRKCVGEVELDVERSSKA